MRARYSGAIALVMAGILSTSCGGIIDPSSNQVDTFSGTVPKGGFSAGYPFTVSKTGEFTVKLTALSPQSGAVMGVAYSQAAGDGSCFATPAAIGSGTSSFLNTPALSGQIFSGRYCVYVYDLGALTGTVTFTATVSHP